MAIQDDNTIVTKGDLKALYTDKIAPYLGANMMMSTNVSDYYSTDEKVVGVWTDGKPVYQKTWVNVNVSGMIDGVNHNIIDITSLHADTTVKIEAIAHQVTSGQKFDYANNFFSPDTSTTNLKVNVWRRAENYIGFNATVLQITSVNVTFCYTKTTDTAGSATATPGAYDINFPNTWPVDKEIYFGNGVYGKRNVRTTTTATNTQYVIQTGVSKIVSCGGTQWRTGDGYGHPMAVFPQGTAYPYFYIAGATMSGGTGTLSIWGGTATMQGWDVWATYTK